MSDVIGLALLVTLLAVLTALGVRWGLVEVQVPQPPGRRAIGIELDERYCEIAARRLAQGVLDFGGAS